MFLAKVLIWFLKIGNKGERFIIELSSVSYDLKAAYEIANMEQKGALRNNATRPQNISTSTHYIFYLGMIVFATAPSFSLQSAPEVVY